MHKAKSMNTWGWIWPTYTESSSSNISVWTKSAQNPHAQCHSWKKMIFQTLQIEVMVWDAPSHQLSSEESLSDWSNSGIVKHLQTITLRVRGHWSRSVGQAGVLLFLERVWMDLLWLFAYIVFFSTLYINDAIEPEDSEGPDTWLKAVLHSKLVCYVIGKHKDVKS